MNKNQIIKLHYEIYKRIPSAKYVELYFIMQYYSNSEFPIIDFLNDIELNKDPKYNKDKAFDDLEKIYTNFLYYYIKYKENK